MLRQIERALPGLSRAERRAAAFVLAHPREAAGATLADVARASGTSEPTVIRFCRRLGLGGFRELGRRLTEDLSRPVSYLHRDVGADDSAADAVTKVLDASIQSLIDTRSELSAMPVDAAVSAMASARQIAFAGLGASGHVAADACHKFFRLGVPCSSLADSPGILQFSAVAAPGDVLVLVSTTGEWPELVEAATIARERGATVIALSDPASPLAAAAKLVFPQSAVEDTGVYTPMSSRLAQLAILDALQVALALAIGAPAVDNLRRAKAVLKRDFSR